MRTNVKIDLSAKKCFNQTSKRRLVIIFFLTIFVFKNGLFIFGHLRQAKLKYDATTRTKTYCSTIILRIIACVSILNNYTIDFRYRKRENK